VKKNILITGGAGFVGSALTKRLVAEDEYNVAVLDDFSRGKQERLPTDCLVFRGDICDLTLVAAAVNWADLIWHLAYVQGTQVFTENPAQTAKVALNGLTNLLNCCEEEALWHSSFKELMIVSSSEANNKAPKIPTPEEVELVVPDPRNPRFAYGCGKIMSEVAGLAYGHAGLLSRVCVVRPHNIYGPDAGEEHVIPQFARRILDMFEDAINPMVIQGSGLETRSFNYIEDAVNGLLTVQNYGVNGEIYHVGAQEEVTMEHLAKLIARYYDRSIEIMPSELPKGSPARRCPDISKLKALGYRPTWSLANGLVPTLAWYESHPLVTA